VNFPERPAVVVRVFSRWVFCVVVFLALFELIHINLTWFVIKYIKIVWKANSSQYCFRLDLDTICPLSRCRNILIPPTCCTRLLGTSSDRRYPTLMIIAINEVLEWNIFKLSIWRGLGVEDYICRTVRKKFQVHF